MLGVRDVSGRWVSRSRPGTYNLMPGHQRDVLNPRRTLALIKTNHWQQQPNTKNAWEKGKNYGAGITLKPGAFLCHFSTVPRSRSPPLLAGQSFVAHFPRICHALTLRTRRRGVGTEAVLHILSSSDIALDDFSTPVDLRSLCPWWTHFFATFKVPWVVVGVGWKLSVRDSQDPLLDSFKWNFRL